MEVKVFFLALFDEEGYECNLPRTKMSLVRTENEIYCPEQIVIYNGSQNDIVAYSFFLFNIREDLDPFSMKGSFGAQPVFVHSGEYLVFPPLYFNFKRNNFKGVDNE